ncbi:MAG: hypothetical protein IPH84_16855 [Bacteroidales bacterium]|nr:hypothetical protein [Bacteroidales bacterium]
MALLPIRATHHTPILQRHLYSALTITDTAGCEGSRSHTLIVTPPPTALFSSATDNCQGPSGFNQSTRIGLPDQLELGLWR